MIFAALAAKFGPRWALHFLPYIVMGVVALVIYQKLTQATSNTTVESGGKVVNVYQDGGEASRIPLGGCATYRLNAEAYWKTPPARPNQ